MSIRPYPLVLSTVCQERIWGGSILRDQYAFAGATDCTGEGWVISAHPNGPSRIENGPFQGKTLSELLTQVPDWFGPHRFERFPLLVKLLDCRNDLSVQVHPNDEYAKSIGELGKTECWYIVDAEPGAEIILGHTAQTSEEFRKEVEAGNFESLLKRVPAKKGDFFFVPSGTVHGIGKGLLVFETQQSSDVTYRLYDYNRKDAAGKTRDLHLEESIAVTECPARETKVSPAVEREANRTRTQFVSCDYFTVEKWNISGAVSEKSRSTFSLLTVLDGSGAIEFGHGDMNGIESITLNKGVSLLVPATLGDYRLTGQLECMVSWV